MKVWECIKEIMDGRESNESIYIRPNDWIQEFQSQEI